MRTTRRELGLFLCTGLIVAAAQIAAAADAVAPSEAAVASVTFAGSGCPAVPAAVGKLSADLSTLLVALPLIEAKAGDGVSLRAQRVNCDIVVTIKHSGGFQLAATGTTAKTSGNFTTGAAGVVGYRTHFQGQVATQSAEATQTSPGEVTLGLDPAYGPCGKTTTLVQSFSVRIDGRPKEASILKLENAGATTLAWRTCK